MNKKNSWLLEGKRTFIIAELSANHNGSFENAKETIRAAKRAGADAIKLQTYTPDTITIDCSNEHFQINEGTLWDGKTLYQLYGEAYTPWEWHKELFEVARNEGLTCFSSPFDKSAVDLLEELDCPIYKIASFEIQDIPLIEYIASKGKPMIFSTGIATLKDIELAVETCYNHKNKNIALLKCTSAYPAPFNEANLKTIIDLKSRFNIPIGFSDHTIGNTAAIVAYSLGARIIEKHFILDRSIGGPDASFSLNEQEFKAMVDSIREAEDLLGEVSYKRSKRVEKNLKFARSLFVVKDIKKGESFSNDNVRSIRPGNGMHPKYYNKVLTKKAIIDLKKGTPLSWSHISE
tara:strand:+ start:199 stop:1242 length:1044 start_codon:yes stop_codon:yes gene_type:complete